MTDDDPERRLFDQALDQPAGPTRDAWLANTCAGDPALEARIRALLYAHEDETPFLPEKEGSPITTAPERNGEMIGPYKLREQIGEGGFGTVWVADQEKPVRRRVALKIIKMGMDTKEVIARFEQERQALALMDHPNIAKVLDAGATDHGRPFFIMELVRGVRITDYCDDQKLSTRERLELFITVCQAVQHAHQKGIIHRDLKPSNILVTINDGVAVPKVIDFGVAKATQGRLSDATVYTQFQQMIGTPLYMSPEQAEMTSLDIDTRSDIYALGVLLYELLTGHTPIDQDTMARIGLDEMRRMIREVDPPRPSARVKTLAGAELTTAAKRRHTEPAKLPGTLRGDIDWIVMKCLEKDRKRRYDTANGLALDLQRHLKNEVITARPPTAGYLLGKLIRRNKLAFAAGLAVTAALLIGLAASVWQAMRATGAENLAKAEAERATAALEELRATAPAFAEQARGLVARERFDEAIEKLDYALRLRPDVIDYVLAKADLLQCQLRFTEAAAGYRAVLARAPEHARAQANAALCDRLQAEQSGQAKLSRESLVQLLVAMAGERRSAAEMLPVGRLAGEEKKLVLEVWLARLKDLPVPPKVPLKERLTMRDDGLLDLNLSGTAVADLSPLEDMPLASLDLSQCRQFTDLRPLSRLPLQTLDLSSTNVTDLAPLASIRTLTTLNLMDLNVRDLSALRGLPLTEIILNGTQVSDLQPLHGMPLQSISLGAAPVSDLTPLAGLPLTVFEGTAIPASDFSPLAGAPLEIASFQNTRIGDLAFLRGMPLKLLALNGCEKARGFGIIAELKTLETLVLPANAILLPAEELAAIAALRGHPALRHLELGLEINMIDWVTTQSADDFWKRWDLETAKILELHEASVKFTVSRQSDGTLALVITDAAFSDLSGLKGANIGFLDLRSTAVTDLTPLGGMPLTSLYLDHTAVSDLTPVGDLALNSLSLRDTKVTDLAVLRRAPLCAALERLWLYRTKVTDFTPIAACTALTVFDATDTSISDLAPLRGRKLREIYFANSPIRDISVLAGMPLERIFFDHTAVGDVTPLLQCRQLEDIILPKTAQDVTALRQLPRLERVSYSYDEKISGPSMTAEVFWMEPQRGGFTAETIPILAEQSPQAPQETLLALKVAALQVWFGRGADYVATCRRMIEAVEGGGRGDFAGERAAKAWCLRVVDDASMRERVLALVRKEAADEEVVEARPWYQQTLGMAEFRAGNDDAAEAALLKAEKTAETGNWNPPFRPFIQGPARFFRAMILFRNGKRDEAQKLFHTAEAQMPPLPENEKVLPADISQDLLVYWLAYKEAGALLGISPTKKVRPPVAVLLPPTSAWKWLHPLHGVDPAESAPGFHTAFFAPDYDDSAWTSGQDSDGPSGGFGYGDAGFTGVDLGTPSTKEAGHAAYFRARFTTDQPHVNLELRCQRDDGLIVYLDGKEVARHNMDDGPEAYLLPASRIIGDGEETTLQRIPLPGVSLPAGEHVLAISLHNPEAPSSDLRIGGITLVEVESAPAAAP